MSKESSLVVANFIRDNNCTEVYVIPDEDQDGDEIDVWNSASYALHEEWEKIPLEDIDDFNNMQDADMNDAGLMFQTGTQNYFLPYGDNAHAPPLDQSTVQVTYRFRVTDEATLRSAYERYCASGNPMVNEDCNTPEDIVQELITGRVLGYSSEHGTTNGWEDFGLERVQ